MSREFDNYGELDPDEALCTPPILRQAAKDFLWPTDRKSTDQMLIVSSSLFSLWCDWWMHNLYLWPPPRFIFPRMPSAPLWWVWCLAAPPPPGNAAPPGCVPPVAWKTWIETVPKESRLPDKCENILLKKLDEAWKRAWDVMAGEDCKSPGSRDVARGMKFCLIVQTLRCGRWTQRTAGPAVGYLPAWLELGRTEPMAGPDRTPMKSSLVTWLQAWDSASFLLAASVLVAKGKIIGVRNATWNGIPKDAATIAAKEDPGDFDVQTFGMTGARKALRLVLPLDERMLVTRLAAEYGKKSKSLLAQWVKDEEIAWWFANERC